MTQASDLASIAESSLFLSGRMELALVCARLARNEQDRKRSGDEKGSTVATIGRELVIMA
jgi:hypothetical protein